MSKQSKLWSQYEDNTLKLLKEQRGIEKWCLIAKVMEDQFKIFGKSGKKCRERYFYHIDSNVKKHLWTPEQEKTLERLHNQKGNKWVQIASQLQRTDNDVKNHFHCRMRKSLRKINMTISTCWRNEFKPLKNNIISKILQTSQEDYQEQDQQNSSANKLSNELKNKMLNLLDSNELTVKSQINDLKILIKDLNQFNRVFKKKSLVKNDDKKEKNRSNKYKGKEILSLINENKILSQRREEIIEQSEGSESLQVEPSQQSNKSSDYSRFQLHQSQGLHFGNSPHPSYLPVFLNPYHPMMHPMNLYGQCQPVPFNPLCYQLTTPTDQGNKVQIGLSSREVKREEAEENKDIIPNIHGPFELKVQNQSYGNFGIFDAKNLK